jgi:hypothetical protein
MGDIELLDGGGERRSETVVQSAGIPEAEKQHLVTITAHR